MIYVSLCEILRDFTQSEMKKIYLLKNRTQNCLKYEKEKKTKKHT